MYKHLILAMLCAFLLVNCYVSTSEIHDESDIIHITTPPGGSLPPGVLVNDGWYSAFRTFIVPELDDSWTFIGEIQSNVRNPSDNLSSNTVPVGSRVYHSYEGRITINEWGFAGWLSTYWYGDTIIVVVGEQHQQFISQRDSNRRIDMLNGVWQGDSIKN